MNQESGDGWQLYHGDSCEVLTGLPGESVGYSIFSPPFTSLYTYSASPRDLGNCKGDDEFFAHFGFIVDELMRVTKPGRLCSFHCMLLPSSKVMHGQIGLRDFRGDLIRCFVARGWIHHSEVVIWKDPVTAMQRTKAIGLLYKQLRKDSCMSRQGIPDYVITMRKPGDQAEADRVGHQPEDIPLDEWQQLASPVWMNINPSETLQHRSARENNDERHICPLQLEVIRRCLRLWSKPGDVVLSPFAGIGSEGYVSIELGRRFVGVELKASYFRQAVANLRSLGRQASLFEVTA
jgi:hypothetical protein